MIEGIVRDATGLVIATAKVKVRHLTTGQEQEQTVTVDGLFRFPALAVGAYSVEAEAPAFARWTRPSVNLSVDQTVHLEIRMEVAAQTEVVTVSSEDAEQVQTTSVALGSVVPQRQAVELPLNGRNFTQLGLLQLGVVPLTSGVATHGGVRRSGQAYSVNGQRPESNNYLIDGARMVNRVDGGFAIRLPVDAIEEFKILTHTAAAEYGGASGSITTVITKSGSNSLHGSLFEFLRNDVLDARNTFAPSQQPLKQHQFGGTLGGPVVKNRLFYFAYYEGFENRQGLTRGSSVPGLKQRRGDFSDLPGGLMDLEAGAPFPGGVIPESRIHPLGRRYTAFYPEPNVTPTFSSRVVMLKNTTHQWGVKGDWMATSRDTVTLRYAWSTSDNVVPISILGADIPGFPVGDYPASHLAALSHVRTVSPRVIHNFRASFFRHDFLMEKRLSGLSPRTLGFGFDTSLEAAMGAPFMLVHGYSSVGDPAIGPRDTVQNNYEIGETLTINAGAHAVRFGGEFRRIQLNAVQGHFSNGVFQFSGFPANNSLANLLMGRPSVFTQAGGDFHRALRGWDSVLFVQDDWRLSRSLTINLGLRHEINAPFAEASGKLTSFSPGMQSLRFPDAPRGVLFPGDPGITTRIAPIYRKGFGPRVGIAWNAGGRGDTVIRTGFGIFYDQLANGVGGPLRVATQSVPWIQVRSITGARIDFANPFGAGDPGFQPGKFIRPLSTFTIENRLLPPYVMNWNFGIQRRLGGNVVEARYVGTKGTRLPRFAEGNPAVYQPGATAANADRRRIYADCPAGGGPCSFGHMGLVTGSTNSTYHAAQAGFRRDLAPVRVQVSYTFSKLLDYVSSLHLAGPAPLLISGENDVAQNPFNLRAEHGPSLFDAKHRLVATVSWEVPSLDGAPRWARAVAGGWQLHGILVASTATPFTVYDSRNVSLQAPHPPLSGVFASRPDVIAGPNLGPRTREEWMSRSAFRRLDPVAEAGQFGNAGRNIVRGPGLANLDASLTRWFHLTESTRIQLRLESFNVGNFTNLGLPVNDLVSPNFGRILEAGPPRLFQAALKFAF
ncbi:MAG: carboxypeptidase regulatory-like domain-containing protein [Acidobacteriota bacterium]